MTGARGPIRWRRFGNRPSKCSSRRRNLEAKELFEYLRGLHPDQVAGSALRSFQRRVLQWRLQHGRDKEVFFEQEHLPGRVMQLDWTNANELARDGAGSAAGAFVVSLRCCRIPTGRGPRAVNPSRC